ncbi:MAG: NAD(P)H-dependent glycerol-3-phosphate dehydrogenase [Alphaproteobacteria bacterium]|nr:MAG: glycerol-3-phosphate dehydrogenase [Rickettsiaceae bacterium 4572_127]
MFKKTISIIGAGRWGSLLAWYHNFIGNSVLLCGRKNSENFASLSKTRENNYLTLSSAVELTTNLEKALENQIVFISIPAQKLRSLAKQIKPFYTNQIFVLCMKGLENETGKRLSEVMREELGNVNTAILVGPGHAQSITKKVPTCMLVDATSKEIKNKIIDISKSELIRLYEGDDLVGNEIGSATKNLIGIASGMLDGLGYFELKGALITRGASEISRLIEACGGNKMSAYGLSHLGDYGATVFSTNSHNRLYGESFILGKKQTKRAEGVDTLRATLLLKKKLKIEMPIVDALEQVLFLKKEPKKVLLELFSRPLKTENL